MKKYSKSIATQLFYQHTPIDTAIYKYLVCYNFTTKYTVTTVSYHLFTFVKTW